MENPVYSAVEVFLSIYENLPAPITAICSLSLALLFVGGLITLLWGLR